MTIQLKIVYKKTADLIPYARNSRTHDEAQIAQIAASIKEFGWTNPILLDGENGIIAGHGRVMAAQKLNEDKVPTIELAHLNDIQKRAYIIADNKLALNSGWDNEMLQLEMETLQDAGYGIDVLGFDDKELKALFGNLDNVDDDVKEPVDESRNLLMIECEGERELETLFEEMQKRGFECKILS
jgi:ParB-like chromosome segregation protein Spo0J